MSLRIAVGGFMHETNTFAPQKTGWGDFVRPSAWPGLTIGEPMRQAFQGLNLAVSQFWAEAERAGHRIHPLAWGAAQPAGRVTDDAFEIMAALLVGGIAAAKPDAVFIELHGAMCSERFDDAETELMMRIRAVIGPDVPLMAALDLHGNIGKGLVDTCDLLSAYRTYPHVDWGDTGRRIAQCFEKWRSVPGPRARAWRRLPFLVPIPAGCTLIEPMKGLYALLAEIEAEMSVHLSLLPGFPAADIAACAPTVIGYGLDQPTVDAAVDRLAAAVLAAEPAFAAHHPLPAAEGVAHANTVAQQAVKPVVLADTCDNPGGGGTGATTGLLRELTRQKAERAILLLVHEPAMAAAAHQAGEGARIPVVFGIGTEGPGQEPYAVEALVEKLSDGRFVATGPMQGGTLVDQGPTALLQVDGIRVIVITVRQQPLTRAIFDDLKMSVDDFGIIALKSSVHFRNHYQEIAGSVLVVETPGLVPADPAALPFTKLVPGMRLRPAG